MLLSIILIITGSIILYISSKDPVAEDGKGEIIRVEIPEGKGSSAIAQLLQEKNVIQSAAAMKIYIKLNSDIVLKSGKYDLNNSENLEQIISHIANGEVAKEEVKITFIEGKNIRQFAKVIADKTVNTEEDVFELLEDEEYINSLIEKYWFITEDVKNEDIYYALEGYLLPDTYIFENDKVSVKTIFNVMLNYMENFLDEYKDIIGNVHQVLTLASMAELEGVQYEDRQEIVGVFVNRINKGMSLGSDVTTYYAFKINMGERDLTSKELNTENPYNTRGPNMISKLPVGPICNPSKDAIKATLNYKETDNLYFVADKNKKVYFTKNESEHSKIISQLKKDGLWYVYE